MLYGCNVRADTGSTNEQGIFRDWKISSTYYNNYSDPRVGSLHYHWFNNYSPQPIWTGGSQLTDGGGTLPSRISGAWSENCHNPVSFYHEAFGSLN